MVIQKTNHVVVRIGLLNQAMRLIPLGLSDPSSWTDGGWFEKPGHPSLDGCWIHAPREGQCLPEFYFIENHEKIKGEPPPELCIGSGPDCHIRLDDKVCPRRLCCLKKRRNKWYIEALLPSHEVSLQGTALELGRPTALKHGDIINLPLSTGATSYQIEISESQAADDKEIHPNRYPARFPCRSSLLDAPEAPEELRRLAWQTDQMRRRSENDQVRVADWSNFSQYVKQHYLKHGINCSCWKETGRGRPWDPKLPSLPAQPLPPWISDLLKEEHPVAGVKERPLPFTSSLRASGVEWSQEARECCDPTVSIPPAKTEDATGMAAATASGEKQSRLPVTEVVNPDLLMSVHEWLESIDDSGFMLQYYDQIVSNFDSLKQIHDVYFREGCLDSQFFVAAGIAKLGHKRIIEKWFREKC